MHPFETHANREHLYEGVFITLCNEILEMFFHDEVF